MPLVMKRRAVKDKERVMIAYDLETTRIDAGTPEPRYLSLCDEEGARGWVTNGYAELASVMQRELLTHERAGVWFVAWNGNRFDVYLIIRALIVLPGYVIHPLLSGSGALRGVWVERGGERWYFYDGIAMTGLIGTSLAKFVASFAPAYPKMELDLDSIAFDATNPLHVAYAHRDTEGLYHAIHAADGIVRDFAGIGLQSTVGNLGIKYFQSQMPPGAICFHISGAVKRAVADSLMRGGYCWCAEQWHGDVDKYDINQAYAHSQRATALPCGPVDRLYSFSQSVLPCMYRVRLSHTKRQRVPFYGRDAETGKPFFTHGKERECWITSDEYRYLLAHGWGCLFVDGYGWRASFNMRQMVDVLEYERANAPDGPSGPRGTMLKMIGNNAYGKTAEQLSGMDIIASGDYLSGWLPHPAYHHVYERPSENTERPYHVPQVSAFITAAVRCQVMAAANLAGGAFLYADTDSLMVKRTAFALDIDPKRYGAWKVEAIAAPHIIIGKKIYARLDTGTVHCKGLRTRELTLEDMHAWYAGKRPVQSQIQRNGVMKFIHGATMFHAQERHGTDVAGLETASLNNRVFIYRA